jgi:hypothetical protein
MTRYTTITNCLIVFLTLFSINTHAQKNFIGFRGGPNFCNANPTGVMAKSIDGMLGIHAGITFEHFFHKNLSYGVDALYNQHGFHQSFYVPGFPIGQYIGYDMQLNFISVPVKLSYTTAGKWYVNMNAGAVPSYLVNAQAVVTSNQSKKRRTIKTEQPAFDISLLAEAGFGVRTKNNATWFILGSYHHSITPHTYIFNQDKSNISSTIVAVSLGYKKPLGNKKQKAPVVHAP